MLTVPGKYIGPDQEEYSMLITASDGQTGEKTVLYRHSGGGRFYSLSIEEWNRKFTPVEEAALKQHLAENDPTDIERRFLELFSGRETVYTIHWKNAFASEGYNYACANSGIADGCMAGTDSCKNCRQGKFKAYGLGAVRDQLSGAVTAGVFPVSRDGRCSFAVIEAKTKAQARALLSVCREKDIPAYCEMFRGGFRVWFFFASPVAAKSAASLGNCVITAAMNVSPCVTFELYDAVSPKCRDIAEGSFGKPVILPLCKSKRFSSCFIGEDFKPLPYGDGAIIGFRTLTKGYLADRLNELGNVDTGRFNLTARQRLDACEFPATLNITAEAMLKIDKTDIPAKTLSVLRRMCAFKAPDAAEEEFAPSAPVINQCFTETEREMFLPRGVFEDLKALLKLSAAEYTFTDKRTKGRNLFFGFNKPLSGSAAAAAREALALKEGIILGSVGSGKTMAVAKIIGELSTNTLILTADETTRRRWMGNILGLFGIDCEKSGDKIDIRLMTDEKIKDKYGLVILADCSRLPMNDEIFRRISRLSPANMYAITADDKRRDGLWAYFTMLCGDIIYRM